MDRVHAIIDGAESIEPALLETAREQVRRMSGGRAKEAQAVLAAVGFEMCPTQPVFRALISRFEAFMAALAYGERQAIWATRGWVRMSDQVAGRLAPARFLHAIAATCPLRTGDDCFDMVEFERRAERVFRALR